MNPWRSPLGLRHPPQPWTGEGIRVGPQVQDVVRAVLYDAVPGRGVSGVQCVLFDDDAKGALLGWTLSTFGA